jgi:hypothetical protein
MMWPVLVILVGNFLAVLALDLERELDLPYPDFVPHPGTADIEGGRDITNSHNEVCWERCFQVEDTDEERFREVYDDLYRMGMEARRLKNLYGVNGMAIIKVDCWGKGLRVQNLFRTFEDFEFHAAFTDHKNTQTFAAIMVKT